MAPTPRGLGSNSSNTSSNLRSNTRSMTFLVCLKEWGLPFECRLPRRLHKSGGNRSVLLPAHCANYGKNASRFASAVQDPGTQAAHTLINVGPALAIWRTRKSYHHTAPHLSPPSVRSGGPTRSIGAERKTGVKMSAR
jgi:hypothetical protein